jgi:hypothetical protein
MSERGKYFDLAAERAGTLFDVRLRSALVLFSSFPLVASRKAGS